MKKPILILSAMLISLLSMAQPTGETFPDFTFTDIEGEEHHLQSYLDAGKTVVIDVFATWCPICANSTGGMEELYTTYGQGGDESMVILTFERDPNTSNEQSFINTHGVQSPVITEATDVIADVWNVTYQPRYFVICPDGSFNDAFIPPVYDDPQDIGDHAMECASVTSVSELDLESEFSLISTAVDQALSYSSLSPRLEYSIIDLTGSVALTGVIEQGINSLDVSSLPQGMYLINVSDDQRMMTKRFIKQG